MAKFQPIVNIWALTDEERAKLQPGQWVCAGPDDSSLTRGVFCGVRQGSSVVVMWMGNAQGRYRSYRKALMEYAKGGRRG